MSRAFVCGALSALLVAGTRREVAADVIMSAAGLNATLKTLERLKRQAEAGPKAERDEALFMLGAESDGLANLMNEEVEAHGMQERELLDLALSRTKELAVSIAYNREKKKFFYDGTAFNGYLKSAPAGPYADAAAFKLLSYQFFQSSGTDAAAIAAAATAKQKFLARYPRFKGNPELNLYLAIDYRDLYHHYRDAHDATNAEKYRRLVRAEYQRIAAKYPKTEQADAARQLLRRFDEELRSKR